MNDGDDVSEWVREAGESLTALQEKIRAEVPRCPEIPELEGDKFGVMIMVAQGETSSDTRKTMHDYFRRTTHKSWLEQVALQAVPGGNSVWRQKILKHWEAQKSSEDEGPTLMSDGHCAYMDLLLDGIQPLVLDITSEDGDFQGNRLQWNVGNYACSYVESYNMELTHMGTPMYMHLGWRVRANGKLECFKRYDQIRTFLAQLQEQEALINQRCLDVRASIPQENRCSLSTGYCQRTNTTKPSSF